MLQHVLDAGFKPEEIETFRSALERSGKRSVDAFLEHRPEFLRVGKIATACALIPCEDEERLFANGSDSWYEYFFNKLDAKFEDFDKNRVSVLSFNYDRSLEQYLLTALQNAHGKGLEECAEKLQSVPIIHLYGQLGELPALAERGIAFGAPISPAILNAASDGIQIIHENFPRKGRFERAHDLMQKSERVCFIGFGYDRTNLFRLLGDGRTRTQRVIGSALGLTDRECELIREDFVKYGFRSATLDSIWGQAYAFLRHHCPFD
jgi:hypothetical protein